MNDEIVRLGAKKIGCSESEVGQQLKDLGDRFFDVDSPARRACDAEVAQLLAPYPALLPHRDALLDVTRRYLRTPSFLVRYFPLQHDRLDEAAVAEAFAADDASGLSLRRVMRDFFGFLELRCGTDERKRYLDARTSCKAPRPMSCSQTSGSSTGRRSTKPGKG
jgi:hypothetical protein